MYFIRIVLPLSKAIVAVLVLFYGVNFWNSYFNGLIYLSDALGLSLPDVPAGKYC